MKRAILEEVVVFNMLFNAQEFYPNECFGSLWGNISGRDYVVKGAIPHPTIESQLDELFLSERLEKLLRKKYEPITYMKFIGDYHSHPRNKKVEADVSISFQDKMDLDGQMLSIIIGIKYEPGRDKVWSYVDGRTLTGRFGLYRVEMAAYAKIGSSKRIQRIPLLCPHLPGV